MTKPLLFTGLLMLMACPTPPTPNNSPNSTPGSNAAPTPGGNNGPNNGPNNAPNNAPSGENVDGGEQGNPSGNNNAGTPGPGNEEVNNQGANPDGPPPGTMPGSMATGPVDGKEEPVEYEELKIPADEDVEKDGSIMGIFNDVGGKDLPPKYTQKSVESIDHITISGTITCKGDECDVPFILRITPSFQPTKEDGPLSENLKNEEGGTITSDTITRGGGDYSIKVPKSNTPVVLELLLDSDDDGKASIGEQFVIYEGGGGISVAQDQSDIDFQFAPTNLKAPLGGAKHPGENGPE